MSRKNQEVPTYFYIYIYIFEGNTIEKPIDNLIFNRRINWTDFQYKKI